MTDKQSGRGQQRPRQSPATSQSQPTGSPASAAAPGSNRRPFRRPPRPEQGKPLSETAGPDPSTPPEETRLAIGVVIGTHGVRGELKLRLSTDDPEHLTNVKWVYVGDDEARRRVQGVRFHAGFALLKIAGVNTPEQANILRGEWIRIAGKDTRPLDEGEYFYYQLVGLTAFDEEETRLGTVIDIIETGTNDVLVIKSETGDEMLVPNHPDFVPAIEPDKGRLTVKPPVFYS